MPTLSWNEIRNRAHTFAHEWADEVSEDAEAKSFWDDFFNVFGVSRRRVAVFERQVKKVDGKDGFIDLLWKGVILIEHKSRGKNLDRAHAQARGYFHGLKDDELPRYLLVSDFARFRLYDLDTDEHIEFPLTDLPKQIKRFGFIAGYQTQTYKEEDPVNLKAAELMGRLHDDLKASGYDGHPLELYLVRLLFCLFADDTGIFERGLLSEFLRTRTHEDGSDLGDRLNTLFHVLNTPTERRQKALDETLAAFPYVNGKLFQEPLPPAAFTAAMRTDLLKCCALDWGQISPAIFGAMFQSVMDPRARRNLGAHYTSEKNILKLIKPLFLDELRKELDAAKGSSKKLNALHDKLATLNFLDPACGCGNFLVIAYRQLRLLELELIRELNKSGQMVLDVSTLMKLSVDQFHGIEIEEFPAQIAQVAMWLTDHQMNMKVSDEFGQYYARLPLTASANVVHGNALRLDWQAVVPSTKLSFLLGNPPFYGSKLLTEEQRADVAHVFGNSKGAGLLDFVSCWYFLAAKYMSAAPHIRAALVSTNSITQGEQVGILWRELLGRGIHIHFAHRTFQWTNEARGVAAVHCVIIGFGREDSAEHWLFDYETVKADPQAMKVNRINPDLIEAADDLLENRSLPLCAVPNIGIGNKPIDGGHYLFTDEEKTAFLAVEPFAAKWFRRWLGSDEFINGWQRWCLWLGDCPPEELRRMPEVMKRVELVRDVRLASSSAPTRRLAGTPTRFHVENIPVTTYLVIPEVSSEKRRYIPIGFEKPETLCSNLVKIVGGAALWHFGVLTSAMHMAWTNTVCGRLKSDYRYSAGIVYNNYPWPEVPTDAQKANVESAAQAVLDARANHPNATLADLYDPLTMPVDLMKAHQALDRAVDTCYRSKPFAHDSDRMSFLFALYDRYVEQERARMPERRPRRSAGRGGTST